VSAVSAELLQTRLEITTAHDIFDGHLRLGQTIRVSTAKFAIQKLNQCLKQSSLNLLLLHPCEQRILPSFVVPALLSCASDPDALKGGGGALPVTLFDEVLVYLLNHLSGYLDDFNKSPQATSVHQASDTKVSQASASASR
jgi:hypothetical protein